MKWVNFDISGLRLYGWASAFLACLANDFGKTTACMWDTMYNHIKLTLCSEKGWCHTSKKMCGPIYR